MSTDLAITLAFVDTFVNDSAHDSAVVTALGGGNVKVIFAEGITGIPANCFKDQTNIVAVEFPNTVASIGASAFEGCTGLVSFSLPSSAVAIDSDAFKGCTALKNMDARALETKAGEALQITADKFAIVNKADPTWTSDYRTLMLDGVISTDFTGVGGKSEIVGAEIKYTQKDFQEVQSNHAGFHGQMDFNVNFDQWDAKQTVATMTSAGRVGIGTTTPLCSLHNYGTSASGWAGMSYFGNDTTGVAIGTYNNVAYLGGHSGALNAWTNLAINAGGGNVGIGTDNPMWPLDIRSSGAKGPQWSGASIMTSFVNASTDNITQIYGGIDALTTVSLYIEGGTIMKGGQAWVTSDERIKHNIADLDDTKALDMINNIECKEYDYLDPLRKNSRKTIGFIAQDVNGVLPNAVNILTDYLPDELRRIENLVWEDTEVVTEGNTKLKYKLTIDGLDLSGSYTGNCRFYVSNGLSGEEAIMKDIMVSDDKKSFLFDEKWNNVYLWGKEVNDFHTLDKNQLFVLHHSGIQELSRRNDAKTDKISTLESKVGILETENAQLKADMILVKQKLGL